MDNNSQMPFFDLSGTDLNFLLMEDFDEIPSVRQLLDTQLLQEIDKNPQEPTTVEPLPSKETAEIETKTEEPNTARFVKPLSADGRHEITRLCRKRLGSRTIGPWVCGANGLNIEILSTLQSWNQDIPSQKMLDY